ncbi:MAG TPA: 16S rRNA (cytidine(1402)-2'-O)-methyltransferase [Patescibacteria group bacterium]|nr:16S rRNA (cytidine(1402)-2'-O)-methyltransferase [Patescibacteria group bacterium]
MSVLFCLATPLGNLSDLSVRATETLRSVDAILCEDTRVTAKLLAHLGISKPLLSVHQHSDGKRLLQVWHLVEEGKRLALVTDAGTPGISDPGGYLIQEAVRRFGDALKIVPIPGPCAAIAALSVSGFPTDAFLFLGFPPHKKGRKKFFDRIGSTDETVVFYESPHRILKTLEELAPCMGNRPVLVARELTKIHETLYRGSIAQVTDSLKNGSMKGEFVIVVAPKSFMIT